MRLIISILLIILGLPVFSQIAYWRGENNGNDEMANHNVTLQYSAGYESTYKVEGSYGFNFNLSSANRAITATNVNFSSGPRTIVIGRFRTTRTTGVGVIMSNETIREGAKGFSLEHDPALGRLRLQMHNGTTHASAYTSNSSIALNTDYHLAVVMVDANAANAKIYVNGVLANAADSVGLAGSGLSGILAFGSSLEYQAYSIYGTMDAVAIYDCAKTAAQITDLYNNRTTAAYTVACIASTPTAQVSRPRNRVIYFENYIPKPISVSTPTEPEPGEPPVYEGNQYAGMNTLYVNSITGDDIRAGTTPATAIKSIARAIQMAPSFQVIALVDTVHYGQLDLSNWDGTALSNKIIGVYHEYGHRYASISAYETLGSFTQYSGNIWSIVDNDLPVGGLKIPSGVGDLHSRFITPFNYLLRSDGVYYPAGRYPASGFLNSTGAGPVGSRTTYLDDTETTFASGYWDNALINFEIEQWDLERAKVGTYNGSRYSFSLIHSNALNMTANKAANRWYYLSNHINCLAKNGDWAYRDDLKTLYLYSTTNPNTYSWKFVKNERALGLTNCDYVTVKGIRTEGGISMGILVSSGSNVTIDSCAVEYGGANSVHAYAVTNIIVRNSIIQKTSGAGIFGAACTNETYNNNKFRKIGYDYAMLCDNIGSNVGIRCEYRHGTLTINNNDIKEAGYSGITFNTAVATPQPGNVVVKNNSISKVLQMMADGGGIYTNVAPAEDGYPAITVSFRNNYIDSCGSAIGYQFANNTPTYAGIYLDSYAQYVTSDSNIVVHADYGYMTNGYKTNIFQNNLMYDPSNYQQTGYGAPAAYRMTTIGWGGQPNGTKFLNNIAIMRDSTDAAFGLNWNGSSYTSNNTDVDYNKYFNPFDENANEVNKTYNGTTGVQSYHPLSYFRATPFFLEDNTTFNTPDWTYQDVTGITRDQFVVIYYNHSNTAKTFSLGGTLVLKNVVTGNNVTGSITLQPYKGAAYFYVSGSFSGADNPFYNP